MNKTSKPTCKLVGEDGNVFNIIGKVGATLKRAGQLDRADEFCKKTFACHSYDEVLRLLQEYVEVK